MNASPFFNELEADVKESIDSKNTASMIHHIDRIKIEYQCEEISKEERDQLLSMFHASIRPQPQED